ncbi:hypothetical protein PFISCL1PPCAC_9214, partial [Pristionchus fissidentatus]
YLSMMDRARFCRANNRIRTIEQNTGGRKFHEVNVFWIDNQRKISVKVKTGDITFRETSLLKEGGDFTNESAEKLAIYFYNASTYSLNTMCIESTRVNPMLS